MKKILNYLVYVIVYGTWYVASLLPLRVLYIFSDFLYLLIAHVVKYRHKVIWKNLNNSFPEKSDAELRQIEKDFYHYFCDYLVETIKGMSMSEKQIRRRMTFSGTDKLNECWEKGQSCAVYLGHLGNYEWITSLPFWVSRFTIHWKMSILTRFRFTCASAREHYVFQWLNRCDELLTSARRANQ